MAVPANDLFGAQIELELFNDLSFARDPACALALPTAENPCVRESTTLSIHLMIKTITVTSTGMELFNFKSSICFNHHNITRFDYHYRISYGLYASRRA